MMRGEVWAGRYGTVVVQAACREDQMDMEDTAFAGRTANMLFMSVTPEVSQLDISSLKTLP